MKNFWQKLKNKKQPILALAPMAGITDSAFRQLVKNFGADVVYTEMVSADGLFYNSQKTLELLKFKQQERPIIAQLFGKRPECFAEAVKIVEKLGYDGIDINFGCPAKKVVGHGGGISLLKDLDLCYEIVKAACDNTKISVSVKTRTSININKNKKVTAIDFIKKIKDLPVAALMLHGRSYEEGFSGPIDFNMLKKARDIFSGVFLANGGITKSEDAKIILDQTGADGIALARSLYGRPWLFQEIREYLDNEKYQSFGLPRIKKIAIRHAKLLFEAKGQQGILEMRKHLCFYFRGFYGASDVRQKLVRVEKVDDIRQAIKSIS